MQKIVSYLYPNRIRLLADLAGFNVEYINVYQRQVKIYNGIDNILEFDVKNADQKRIDLTTLSNIQMNVMDASGIELPNSPYTVTPLDQTATATKGLAKVTIPQEDLDELTNQYLRFSVTATKDGDDVILYADSRFGATGTIQVLGNAMPVFRDARVYNTFTAEIDLKGFPTWHSSAIPATHYEAIKTTTAQIDVDVIGLTGNVWIEATKQSTINAEAFKTGDIVHSFANVALDPGVTETLSSPDLTIGDYKYFRVSYSTVLGNGIGAAFIVTQNTDNTYSVDIRAGGTGYTVGSRLHVLGSLIGGNDGINDLVITVTSTDGSSHIVTANSYSISGIDGITCEGTAATVAESHNFIVTGTNITGKVDKVTVN